MIQNIPPKDKKAIAEKLMRTFFYNGIPVTSCPFVIPEEFFADRTFDQKSDIDTRHCEKGDADV